MSAALKLLCVDDEPEVLQILTQLLGELGLEVLTAPSGEVAVELMRAHGSRVVTVISDLSMPGISGLELREQLLRTHQHTPFIVLSGHVTRDLALRGLELKISAFLEKPVERKKLLQIVAKESKDRAASILEEDELLAGFVAESRLLLEEIEDLCLQLEDGGGVEVLNRIFACAHTIKGASGYFKPDTVHRFAHKFEDHLTRFKSGALALTPADISVFLRGVDQLRTLIKKLEDHSEDPENLEQLCSIFTRDVKAGAQGAPGGSGKPAAAQPKSSDLRVSISLLDNFMEKSGEITVLRSMINKTLQMVERQHPGSPQITSLADLLGEMHRANVIMQDRIADLRKVQLRQIVKPLQRTLRDLCQNLGKSIRLEVTGDELRVDYVLNEALSKCLIHMLRNAVDHGIELPEQRRSAGKPAEGAIRISCEENGECVIVRVADDGRGINADIIRSKAVAKGVVSAAEAAAMSAAEARLLVFHPGFSTAEQVTDVSGRGVGMDMVKTTLESMNGRIEIESEIGKGTEFIMYLPAPKSVVIISSLLVGCGGQTFALPQDSILRIVRTSAAAKSIQRIKERRFFDGGTGLLPVLTLRELLRLPGEWEAQAEEINLIIIRSKRGLFCLQADEIHDVEDTVVKRLGGWLSGLPIYMGATFLGDGRVGLILDAEGVSSAHLTGAREGGQVAAVDSVAEGSGRTDYLLVECAGGVFALAQREIFRLEEFTAESLGRRSVLIYRDGILPIYGLGGLVRSANDHGRERADRVPVVVVERDGGLVGLEVERIRDLVSVPDDAPELGCELGIRKVIGEETVTVLQLNRLWSRQKESYAHPGG